MVPLSAPEPRTAPAARGEAPVTRTHDEQLLNDTLVYALARGLPALLSLTLLLIATRFLSREALGQYGLVVNFVLLGGSLASGWLEQSALRHYPAAERAGDPEGFLSRHATVVASMLALAVSIAVVAYVVVGDALGPYRPLYPFAVALLLGSIVFYNAQALLMARLRAWTVTLAEITRTGGTLVACALLLLLWKRSVDALFIGLLLGLAGGLVVSVHGAGLTRRPVGPGEAARYAREAVTYGFPVAAWFLGYALLAAQNRLFIQLFRGSAEVGLFHANYQVLPEATSLALTPFLMAAHPLLVRAGDSLSPVEAERVIARFTRYFLLAAVPLVIAISIAAPELTRLLLGAEFREGVVIVPWIAGGLVGWYLGLFANKRFELEKRTGTMLLILGATVALNAVLGLLLVPRYGYLGAAIGIAITYWTYPFLVGLAPGPRIRWRVPWATGARVALAALASLAIAALAVAPRARGLPPLSAAALEGGVALLAFALVVLALGEVDRAEARRFALALAPARALAWLRARARPR